MPAHEMVRAGHHPLDCQKSPVVSSYHFGRMLLFLPLTGKEAS